MNKTYDEVQAERAAHVELFRRTAIKMLRKIGLDAATARWAADQATQEQLGLGRDRVAELGADICSASEQSRAWAEGAVLRAIYHEWLDAVRRRSQSGCLFGRLRTVEVALQDYLRR